MREHRLKSILRKIHGSTRTDMGNEKALEAELLSSYRELHPRNRRWLVLVNPWNRAARLALGGLTAGLLVVAACATETITEVEVGKQVVMNVDSNVDQRFIYTIIYINEENPGQPQQEISDLLTAQPGVEDVSVSVAVEEEGARNVNLDILIFGSDLDGEGLVNAVTDSFPSLSRAAVTINDLRTTFSESLASRIGRTLFGVQGSRPDPHQLRRQVLEQLAGRR